MEFSISFKLKIRKNVSDIGSYVNKHNLTFNYYKEEEVIKKRDNNNKKTTTHPQKIKQTTLPHHKNNTNKTHFSYFVSL